MQNISSSKSFGRFVPIVCFQESTLIWMCKVSNIESYLAFQLCSFDGHWSGKYVRVLAKSMMETLCLGTYLLSLALVKLVSISLY